MKKEIEINSDRVTAVLKKFGIEVNSINATVGPTFTFYEIVPQDGIRISKIKNLEDDITMGLAAIGVRIIAPIPGKGTIGIEVPNAEPQIVSIDEVLSSPEFQESRYDLPLALGKTVDNKVFVADLVKLPHLLIGGATGQGKSVFLYSAIASLLHKKSPEELKLVLIDSKRVEFNIYSDLKNGYLVNNEIIFDCKKTIETLNSLCVEMDNRYELLKKSKSRNIKEHNKQADEKLPYIVTIIDEFCDFIMMARKEIELPIARLAQLGRSVGIHLIISTQRPSFNIITGVIKANFPTRAAFRVSSRIDSRTILDVLGAERLMGKGDMLFSQGSGLIRIQCAFIDMLDIERLVKSISEQTCCDTIYHLPKFSADTLGNENTKMELDPFFEDAARLIVNHQHASTPLIKRKFAIGFNQAGRLMEQLEKAGIVGTSQGSKPREVLVKNKSQLEEILNKLEKREKITYYINK